MIDTSLDFALEFLTAHPNWYIFPLTRLEKEPPLIKDNLNLASNEPKQIREWHARFRGCNWGLALRKSKVIVMDVDRKEGKVGQQTFDDLTLEYGELPETMTVRSPSGGLHYYFNGEHRFGLGKYGFGKDIDSPNYVLIPGCWLCSNSEQGYETITDAPVADAPEWFGELLRSKSETTETNDPALDAVVDLDLPENVDRMIRYLKEGAPQSIQGQGGDKAMYDIVCWLKDNAISESVCLNLLVQYYNTPEHCSPVWNVGVGPDADRLDIKIRNAYRYSNENRAGSATAEYAFGDPEDALDPAEVADYVKAWDKLVEKQDKQKNKKRVEKLFTDEARGIDGLTGEPIEDDPDDPPPGGAGAPPPGDGSENNAPQPDKPVGDEAFDVFGGPEVPKQKQNLRWIRANWVWVVNAERFVRLRDGMMWSVKQFDSYYNNLTQRSSVSNALFSSDTIRKVERLVYRPGYGAILDGDKLVNLWRPAAIKPKQGDTNLWNEHLNYLFKNEDDKNEILNWMAWVYQNPTRKPNHGLLLVGRETGTGKSFIARVLEQLIGPDNTQRPKNTSLKGDFNAWALRCKLCIIEELMQIGRREVANELRDTITESTIEVNIKNVSAQKIENYMALMAITNHRDAMPMEKTERRWLVIETFAKRGEDAYYKKLWPILSNPDALAAIGYELKTRDLGTYDASLSPKETAARAQMIALSRSDVEQWLYENTGNPPLNHNLTTIQDVTDTMPNVLQRQLRLRTTIQTFMRDNLRGDQISRPVRLAGGNRIRLWALHGRFATFDALAESTLASMYEKERRETGSALSPEQQAAEDFDN